MGLEEGKLGFRACRNLAGQPGTLFFMKIAYRFETPRASFLTFFFFDPRGSVRFAWERPSYGRRRFSFFRSVYLRSW